MTVGIPADTLNLAGITAVPEDAMLTVGVKGTTSRPKFDWEGAYTKVAELFLQQRTAKPEEGKEASWRNIIMKEALQSVQAWSSRKKAAKSDAGDSQSHVPPLTEPLPWQQNQEH